MISVSVSSCVEGRTHFHDDMSALIVMVGVFLTNVCTRNSPEGMWCCHLAREFTFFLCWSFATQVFRSRVNFSDSDSWPAILFSTTRVIQRAFSCEDAGRTCLMFVVISHRMKRVDRWS